MPTYTWDVQLPGEDIPRRVTTEYLVSVGEELNVEGLPWVVESVEVEEEGDGLTGLLLVARPHEPY